MCAKCLIIVDMQRGFMQEHMAGLAEAIVKYSEQFEHIAVFKYINNENTACAKYLNWTGMYEGATETKLCPEIAGLLQDKGRVRLFCKATYSCVTEELKQWLYDRDVDEIELAGVSTTCCVLATAYNLMDLGYKVSVVSDLCMASTVERHKAAMTVLDSNVLIKKIVRC